MSLQRKTALARKTAIKRKRATPRRSPAITCTVRGCRRRQVRGIEFCGVHAKRECDRLFSLIVRSRGVCLRCGTTDSTVLQCCHWVSRAYHGTRFEEWACWCGCKSCHVYSHAHQLEWEASLGWRDVMNLEDAKWVALDFIKFGAKLAYAELRPRLRSRLAEVTP